MVNKATIEVRVRHETFISYGSTDDQVTALRLQALAAVNGLSVYVPPVHTRQFSVPGLSPESGQVLHDSDVVLGVIGTKFSDACSQELNAGLALGKPTILMAGPTVAAQLQPTFGANLVVIDPARPDQAEFGIVERLKAMDVEQNQEGFDRTGNTSTRATYFCTQ
ncbi:MAG: hypothetical protein JWO48_3834 [Bryobacterales bacterium]|nr:hypothetical protein [Bryobacterales bacterium]